MPDPDDVAAAVARNVRRLRQQRRWSLDQLASRSGVSKGMLVQLEQGRTNPSLGTMCRISEALSVSLALLVELHDAPAARVLAPSELVDLWTGADGSVGTLLAGLDDRDHVELWRWTLAGGDEHRSEPHLAGTREILHVIDGSLMLDVDDTAYEVKSGAAVVFHADRPHGYRNTHKRPVRFVMVVVQPDADLDADLRAWTAASVASAPTASSRNRRR